MVRAALAMLAWSGAAGGAAGLAGCAADSVTGVGAVAEIVIEPGAPAVAVDRTIRLTATLPDASGQPLADRSVVWSSGDPETAAVSADGVVTPRAVGRVQIAASAEGRSAVVELQVTPGAVATIGLAPSPLSLVHGGTAKLTVSLRDAAGHDVSGRPVSWSTSAASVANVDASGLVTAVAPGTATITAVAEGRQATVSVTVTPVPVAQVTVTPGDVALQTGDAQQLAAVARDASGATLSGRTVVWSSTAPGVATVSSTGLVSAVAAGTADIRATVDGVVGTARVTVTQRLGPVARLEIVSGNGQSARAGTELGQPLVVRATDASGRAVPGVLVTWTPSDGGNALPGTIGLTDAQGLASVRWRLGNPERTQTMRATVTGVATVTFSAEATRR